MSFTTPLARRPADTKDKRMSKHVGNSPVHQNVDNLRMCEKIIVELILATATDKERDDLHNLLLSLRDVL